MEACPLISQPRVLSPVAANAAQTALRQSARAWSVLGRHLTSPSLPLQLGNGHEVMQLCGLVRTK